MEALMATATTTEIIAALNAINITLAKTCARADAMAEDIVAIKELLTKQGDRMAALERSTGSMVRLPDDVHELLKRVESLETWRAGRGENIPDRVMELEKWTAKADAIINLARWSIGGGILGLLSLLYLVFEIARNRLPLP